uniref:Innexin n=1 Tax=Dugesia japonica TaxID=6161 RepID=Q2L6M4_DUGJA|nr:innexin11 [Dugesia japonica]
MIKDLFEFIPWKESRAHLQDFADRMCSTVTVIILFIFSTLVAYKTYFISPMECFSTDAPNIQNLDKYITSYCWVEGTVDLAADKRTPTDNEWDTMKLKSINYYPWIPIILGIQCAFFYLPNLIWREYCFYKGGTDLQNLIEMSLNASKASMNERPSMIKDISSLIENLFHLHRENRHGLIPEVRRIVFKKMPLLIWGKRSGNAILGMYMVIKLLFIGISIFQCFFMVKVLQLDNSFMSVFYDVFGHIFHGIDWRATKYFPRVGYCRLTGMRSVGVINNKYVAQCVLPINILNEKIFIFLFLWMFMLIILSLIYFLSWIHIICCQPPKIRMIKLYLKGKNIFSKVEEPLIDKFINEFIRLDGIFLLKMIRINVGDVVTAGVVEQLWSLYKSKYRYVDFSCMESSDQKENLTLRLEPGEQKISTKSKIHTPSAPSKDSFL